MQNAPISKNLLIWLIVVVVLGGGYLLYTFMAGGGYFMGDIPEYRPVETTPAEEAPPAPSPAPSGPGTPASPGLGIAAPGAAPPPVAGGETVPGAAAGPGTGEDREAGEEPEKPKTPLTQEEKRSELAAFEQIESVDIVEARLEEAVASETEVIPEEDRPFPDTGRTDPLMVVNSAIPEELRPPRSGETDYDSILEYLIKSYGTEILESIEIEVWSVMQIGLNELVNMSVNGRLMTMSEGASTQMQLGYQETLRITVASASQSLVTINLTYSNPYGSVSKTNTYIPKE